MLWSFIGKLEDEIDKSLQHIGSLATIVMALA